MRNADKLIKCPDCKALYDKTLKWASVEYEKNTTGKFSVRSLIPEGECPICGRKN